MPSPDGRILVVTVPMSFRRRRGRKVIIVPDCTSEPSRTSGLLADPIVTALVRAHRWKKTLEGGEYASVRELAKAENIGLSYLCRVLRLTLLAPDIVESILDSRVPKDLRLTVFLRPFPVVWEQQKIMSSRGPTSRGLGRPKSPEIKSAISSALAAQFNGHPRLVTPKVILSDADCVTIP